MKKYTAAADLLTGQAGIFFYKRQHARVARDHHLPIRVMTLK